MVRLDQTRINLYPTLGVNTTDTKKTHSFNIAKAAFTSEQCISTDSNLVATTSRLNYHTQMSSAIQEVVSKLDNNMFNPANMIVANYLTRMGAVIPTVAAMIPVDPNAVPPTQAPLKPAVDGAVNTCRLEISFVTF